MIRGKYDGYAAGCHVAEYLTLLPKRLLGLPIDPLAILMLPLKHDRTHAIARYYFIGNETMDEQYASTCHTEPWLND